MRLTQDQERAVRSWQRGDICVVAGPGAGKTRVLVERIKWLILDRDVPPEHVLAITFTEKAAHEMRSRLVSEGSPSPETRRRLEAASVSTIDAFCNRLLKENALEAGVDPGFEILDENEARELLRTAIEHVLDEAFVLGGDPLRAFLDSYGGSASRFPRADSLTLLEDLSGLVSSIRSYGSEPFLREPEMPRMELASALRALANAKKLDPLADLAGRLEDAPRDDPDAVPALLAEASVATARIHKRGKVKALVSEIKDRLLPSCMAAAASEANRSPRQWLLETVRRILAEMQAAKLAAGRMDFDDVLAKAADLLGSGHAPKLHFEHILIDEFQDTNPLQIRLVERLLDAHGPNRPVRFVVGDINQSIYGFRHADQNVFREYRARVEKNKGEVIRLMENFRSRSEVLGAVHRVLPGGPPSGVETHRLQSASIFPESREPRVEVRIVTHGDANAFDREARWLARRLHELKAGLHLADRRGGAVGARALQWGDVAVLARTRDRVSKLAAVLRQAGVPCEISSGQRLFEAPECIELAAFLRVVRNPRDEISLAAVLKSPLCGIDDADLLRLRRDHANIAEALTSPCPGRSGLGKDAEQRLQRFAKILSECRADRATLPVRFLLARAVSSCGYRSFLSRSDDGPRALANLDRLLDWIGRREEQGAAGMDAVSEALDRASVTGSTATEAPHGAQDLQAVKVLTMHGAKGLEFPVVALASLQSNPSGSPRGLLFSEDHGIGARWREPFDGGPCADSAYRAAAAEGKRREREEADRLLYVAMTRAEEHLVLSASFAGTAQKRHWCKLVFQRLGLNPKEDPNGEPAYRLAGDVRFLYHKTWVDPPGGEAPSAAPESPEPEILLPLPPSAQADYVAAVTAVATFAQCPRRYFLSRYLKLEQAGPAPSLVGLAAAGGSSARDGTDPSHFGEEVHRHLAGQLNDARPSVRRMAASFLQHELGKRAASASRMEREMAFVFTVGDHLLRGTIDLLFEEGGERILLDYKTDRVPRHGVQRAAQRYAPQIQLYAAGLAKSGRPADRAVLFYLRHAKPIDIDIGADSLASARNLVGSFFEAQERQEYPLKTGKHCLRCPHYRAECPAQFQ